MKTTSTGSRPSRRERRIDENGFEIEVEDESAKLADEAALRQEDDASWEPMETAPKDRIIEGLFDNGLDPYPIRWRNSRRRVGRTWVDGGVWHLADTAGAVQVHPVGWREWNLAPLRFEAPETPEAA